MQAMRPYPPIVFFNFFYYFPEPLVIMGENVVYLKGMPRVIQYFMKQRALKMKRKTANLFKSVSIAAALLLTVSTTALADEASQASDPARFVSGTSINGIAVSGLTVNEAKAQIELFFNSNYSLTLIERDGKKESINGSEINYRINLTGGLQELLDQQNTIGRDTAASSHPYYTLVLSPSYDEAALKRKIASLSCVSGSQIIPTTNAHVSSYQEGQPFTIIKEVQGDSIHTGNLTAAIQAAISSGWAELNVSDTGCYDTIQITSENESLKNLCNTMNQCKDMVITYHLNGKDSSLTGEKICSWLTGTDAAGQISVNETLAAQYIREMAAQNDTAGTARVFHTTSGKDVTLTGPFGKKLDQAAETAALIAMIRTGQSQERVPQYAQGSPDQAADWGTTYVEIDLGGQHVYLYQKGTLVWDAPCVTGNLSKDYTTPEGIYSLNYKQTDRILRGAKKADGTYEYESHVDYWMPFNGGIGLHDASWRSKFGGTIYQYGGSHGCINLPKEKAKLLYDLITPGIPVICHN